MNTGLFEIKSSSIKEKEKIAKALWKPNEESIVLYFPSVRAVQTHLGKQGLILSGCLGGPTLW